MKLLSTIFTCAMLLFSSSIALAAEPWDKTFPQSDKVTTQKVAFYNRLGINIAGDLYLPKNINMSQKHPAILLAE